MTRPRRSGISYIQNNNSRSITFFKRRAGLYKTAADLSTLTGARVAIALESESGKMSSFGTPSAGPIIDSFLSGKAPMDPFVNKEQKSEITILQNEVFKVEKEKFMEDKRTKETIARAKEVQETLGKAKLAYGKIEDLSVEELNELVHDLSQIEQEIDDRLRPQQPSYQLEVGGSRDPFLGRPSSSSSPSSQIQMPPRRLPWTPIQPSLQLPKSSWSLPQSSRSRSSLLNPSMLPSAQAQPISMPPFQHSQMPQHALAITFYNEFPPPSSSQQPPTPLPIEAEHYMVEHPENHASTQDFTAGHPFANHQWPSPIPSNEPYYDISLYGLNLYLGDHGDYGGLVTVERDMAGPSGLHQQTYDCPYRNFLGSSSSGESHGDYGPGNNVGDMAHLGDS
ncbi:hypothetical protein SETIT_2G026600v2 [Setaria italica]|uniref:MADS-box domain-containing protein n=1 Tax=Setaria italica TaxID=4555 RepID=A0A368PUF6_SETIT|nr:hypothetical protein SETIT_2G026600v2 [Setaria italica]